jgi:hypothetical protein
MHVATGATTRRRGHTVMCGMNIGGMIAVRACLVQLVIILMFMVIILLGVYKGTNPGVPSEALTTLPVAGRPVNS